MSQPLPTFSFTYGARQSSELLTEWRAGTDDAGRRTWTDEDTGLVVTLEQQDFADSAAVEWVLRFENTGTADSLLLDDVRALDVDWGVDDSQYALPQALIGRSRGSRFTIADFDYQEDVLLPDEQLDMVAGNGRPSQNWLPFFSIDRGSTGSFVAIGWSGQWAASVKHHRSGRLTMTAGLESFSARLHPGESIRTPRILVMEWSGDRADAHNKLRRFLLENHTPHLDGEPVTGPFTMGAWGAMGSAEQIRRLELYGREQVRQEYFWLDAGWYGADSSYSPDEFQGDWGDFVGDWSVNLTRHPGGLRPIRDAAAAAGMKFLLWAEPGRAIETTPIVVDHPDWFLGDQRERLLDLGNPDAREGAVAIFSELIDECGVDLFREDYNINPLPYWRAVDTPGRVGIAESKYVEGFYWFWDELRRRHPRLIIDNCASGGRRIELETIGRSVALWRSDWQCYPDADPAGAQTQGMGLNMWLPLHGAGIWASMSTREDFSVYRIRSTYSPALQMSAFVRESQPIQEDYPWDWFRQMSDEYLRVRPYFSGDYYPLTSPVSIESQTTVAYQLHRPDLQSGVVLAFRRANSPWSESSLSLRGLDPAATYEVEDADGRGGVSLVEGATLAAGLAVSLESPESSALFFYSKAERQAAVLTEIS